VKHDPVSVAKGVVRTQAKQLRGDWSDPHVVWFCYILGGWKALLITEANDGRYYEVTYDRAKLSVYVDTYVKESNVSLAIPEA
jgi:hypothetical protein